MQMFCAPYVNPDNVVTGDRPVCNGVLRSLLMTCNSARLGACVAVCWYICPSARFSQTTPVLGLPASRDRSNRICTHNVHGVSFFLIPQRDSLVASTDRTRPMAICLFCAGPIKKLRRTVDSVTKKKPILNTSEDLGGALRGVLSLTSLSCTPIGQECLLCPVTPKIVR